MGLKRKGNGPNFEQVFLQAIENKIESIIQRYEYVGNLFATNVKHKVEANEGYREIMRSIPKVNGSMKVPITEGTPRYKDRTTNLTSSIGFSVFRDGVQVRSKFEGSSEGVTAGKKMILDIAKNYPKGIVLIVVAGMNYAAAVESLGYDVLTGSSFIAERDLKATFADLN